MDPRPQGSVPPGPAWLALRGVLPGPGDACGPCSPTCVHPPEGTACPTPSVSTHHHPASYGLLRSLGRHLDPHQALCQPLPSWALATLQSTPRGRVPWDPPRQCGWVLSSHRPQNKALSRAGDRLVVDWCPHILSDTAEPADVGPGSEPAHVLVTPGSPWCFGKGRAGPRRALGTGLAQPRFSEGPHPPARPMSQAHGVTHGAACPDLDPDPLQPQQKH